MIIQTTVLDKAAFFTTFGAKITKVEGKYPENVFTIKTNRLVTFYERVGGWVPYNKFCNERRKIKRTTRKLAGLPEYFTGHQDTKFKLMDLATFKPFSKRERDHLATLE